jgi:hypothetical protein
LKIGVRNDGAVPNEGVAMKLNPTHCDLAMTYRLQAKLQDQKGNPTTAAELIDRAIQIVQRLSDKIALSDSDKNFLVELQQGKVKYSQ